MAGGGSAPYEIARRFMSGYFADAGYWIALITPSALIRFPQPMHRNLDSLHNHVAGYDFGNAGVLLKYRPYAIRLRANCHLLIRYVSRYHTNQVGCRISLRSSDGYRCRPQKNRTAAVAREYIGINQDISGAPRHPILDSGQTTLPYDRNNLIFVPYQSHWKPNRKDAIALAYTDLQRGFTR